MLHGPANAWMVCTSRRLPVAYFDGLTSSPLLPASERASEQRGRGRERERERRGRERKRPRERDGWPHDRHSPCLSNGCQPAYVVGAGRPAGTCYRLQVHRETVRRRRLSERARPASIFLSPSHLASPPSSLSLSLPPLWLPE